MASTLKVQTLIRKGACRDQVSLFRATFGESVEVTEGLCLSIAGKFDFDWAAQNLLPQSVLHGEYKRAVMPAWAAYTRDRPPTPTELECVKASAFGRLYREG
jgi:hypothetical protein